MKATLDRSTVGGLEKKVDILPTQSGSSGNKLPPWTFRPTYQGPADGASGEDPFSCAHLVLGMRQVPSGYQLPQGKASQGKDSLPYHGKN